MEPVSMEWWKDFRNFIFIATIAVTGVVSFGIASIYLFMTHPIFASVWVLFWLIVLAAFFYANDRDNDRKKKTRYR